MIQQDTEEQFEDYSNILSNDDIYQILMSQQEQLQDIGTVLRFIVETQKGNQPHDYRPLLLQMERKIADGAQQQQQIQSTLEKQSNSLQEVDELTNTIKGMNRTLKNQSTNLQQYSNWKDIWQITFIGFFAGMVLLAGTYVLNTMGNAKVEQKLNQLSSQNEKIWKKVK